MTGDILIRREGAAGRITLNRPRALNALTWEMCLEIERALDAWATDPDIALLVIDGAPGRAFCAGGDIVEMYRTGMAGDYDYGRRFWADEYRMNARLFNFPKPVASFLHGFTMGGGVGVGCHGSHRVVGESSAIAMPECGIGLVPDVGGSLILARAPGRLGEYLGLTGTRMGPADAILAGFADYFVPEARWPALIGELCATGDWEAVDRAAEAPPAGELSALRGEIDAHFGGERLLDILNALKADGGGFAARTFEALHRPAPLSLACTVEIVHRVRARDTIEAALDQEYRFTWRAMEHGDFLEGIRAQVIDKDRAPKWRHPGPDKVPAGDVTRMLMPLPKGALKLEGTP